MGNSQSSSKKVNFEDVQFSLNKNNTLLLNTLNSNNQLCLIEETIDCMKEEDIINNLIDSGKKEMNIIIYGLNCNDDKIYSKYKQLSSWGFYNVYIYVGGLFEWLLLQDIYGEEEFPTTSKENDTLKYKPSKSLNIPLLKN